MLEQYHEVGHDCFHILPTSSFIIILPFDTVTCLKLVKRH